MSVASTYVHERQGEFYVGDSRVTVSVVIARWHQGHSPEEIQESFPSCALVEIYGTITYYLEHQAELDAHFAAIRREGEAVQAAAEAANPTFYSDMRARLAAYRGRTQGASRATAPASPPSSASDEGNADQASTNDQPQ